MQDDQMTDDLRRVRQILGKEDWHKNKEEYIREMKQLFERETKEGNEADRREIYYLFNKWSFYTMDIRTYNKNNYTEEEKRCFLNYIVFVYEWNDPPLDALFISRVIPSIERNDKVCGNLHKPALAPYWEQLLDIFFREAYEDITRFTKTEIVLERIAFNHMYIQALIRGTGKVERYTTEYAMLLQTLLTYSGDRGDVGYAYNGLKIVRKIIRDYDWKDLRAYVTRCYIKGISSEFSGFRLPQQARALIKTGSEESTKLYAFYIMNNGFVRNLKELFLLTLRQLENEFSMLQAMEAWSPSEEGSYQFDSAEGAFPAMYEFYRVKFQSDEGERYLKFYFTYTLGKTLMHVQIGDISQVFVDKIILKIYNCKDKTYKLVLGGKKIFNYSTTEDNSLEVDPSKERWRVAKWLSDTKISELLFDQLKKVLVTWRGKQANVLENREQGETALVYLWVESYGSVFEERDFKLSSKYNVSYTGNTLDIKPQAHFEHFFDLDNKKIQDVIVFIGENGSGKTTLVNILKQNCNPSRTALKHTGYILVVEHNEQLFVTSNQALDEMTINAPKGRKIRLVPPDEAHAMIVDNYMTSVFCSNVSNTHNLNNERAMDNTFIDVSVQALRSQYDERALMPLEVMMKAYFMQAEVFESVQKSFKLKNHLSKIQVYSVALEDLRELFVEESGEGQVVPSWLNGDMLVKGEVEPLIRDVIQLKNEGDLTEEARVHKEEFITRLKEKIEIGESKGEREVLAFALNRNEMIATLDMRNQSDYNLLIGMLVYFPKVSPFRIQLQNMSSGEAAILTLFANLYWVLKEGWKEVGGWIEEKNLYKIRGNRLNILIDESDLYLHPEWERIFCRELLGFIGRTADTWIKGIFVYLTSHSPVVISDLPRSNVVYIGEHRKVIDEALPQTFAENIHEIYKYVFGKNSFSMGWFAKERIELAVKYLLETKQNQRKLTDEEITYVKYIIDIVAEPIIKGRLEFLLRQVNFVE